MINRKIIIVFNSFAVYDGAVKLKIEDGDPHCLDKWS